MLAALSSGWSVEIVNFTLGIWGAFAEAQWTAAVTALGVSATRVNAPHDRPGSTVPD
jgi:hypothetical protein